MAAGARGAEHDDHHGVPDGARQQMRPSERALPRTGFAAGWLHGVCGFKSVGLMADMTVKALIKYGAIPSPGGPP